MEYSCGGKFRGRKRPSKWRRRAVEGRRRRGRRRRGRKTWLRRQGKKFRAPLLRAAISRVDVVVISRYLVCVCVAHFRCRRIFLPQPWTYIMSSPCLCGLLRASPTVWVTCFVAVGRWGAVGREVSWTAGRKYMTRIWIGNNSSVPESITVCRKWG